jgi:hypothetical protein
MAGLRVRQGITDRNSTSIANLVTFKLQFLQHNVCTENKMQTSIDNVHLSCQTIGLRQRVFFVDNFFLLTFKIQLIEAHTVTLRQS